MQKILKDIQLLKLRSWKARFDVAKSTFEIRYNWDGGRCYSSIITPLKDEIDELFPHDITKPKDDYMRALNYECHDMLNEWISENEVEQTQKIEHDINKLELTNKGGIAHD